MDKTTHKVRCEQWTNIIKECLASGMPKTTWCREHGISDKSFFTGNEFFVKKHTLPHQRSHKRLYGDDRKRMDWLPYLSYIARKPRSLRNSGIYDMMPVSMQQYMATVTIKIVAKR